MPPRQHSPIVLATPTVEVHFVWIGDRWSHRLASVGGGEGDWTSVEGPAAADGDAAWPESPVFVEITRAGRDTDAAVLAVGIAGRTHFSASIEPDPATPGEIRFEIAARLVAPAVRLGSGYGSSSPGAPRFRVEPANHRPPALPATVVWGYRVGPAGVVALPGSRIVADAERPFAAWPRRPAPA